MRLWKRQVGYFITVISWWARWRLKSPFSRLLTQSFIHAQIKENITASLAFVRGIHRGPLNPPHKGSVTRKLFPFDDVIMGKKGCSSLYLSLITVCWKQQRSGTRDKTKYNNKLFCNLLHCCRPPPAETIQVNFAEAKKATFALNVLVKYHDNLTPSMDK